ncbi:hypothetical protein IM40_02935 [Candidatus Paracaedimonas acanthamoebae]|nr:hypothetical protein IM40_02935 [Candidatus Paracaedimonas acanthamoebae]
MQYKTFRKKLYLASFFFLFSFLSQPTYPSSSSTSPLSSLETLGSEEWAKSKITTYPELEWLLDKNVQHTQEGKIEQFPHSWSKKITGAHYPEFERTILSLVCLYLIADGSDIAYERFTSLQPTAEKLTRDSFQKLHHFAQTIIQKDPQVLQMLEINLILGDMGKTKVAHEKAQKYHITEADHDLFLDECLEKCPEIFSTFQILTPTQQKHIKKTKGLVHLGHVTHVEGGPEILTKLKESGILADNPQEFDFEILTHICDVSAARGHEDNVGSKVMTENTFKTIFAIKDGLHELADHSEQEALKRYLSKRAEWLGLDKTSNTTFLLARMGAMMRLYTTEDGAALQDTFTRLTPTQKALISSEYDPLIYRKEQTPTYVPAILVNLMGEHTKQGLPRKMAINKCLEDGLTFIAHVLYDYRNNRANRSYDPNLTLNFNKSAGQLRDNPNLIEGATFTIDPQGNVELTSSLKKE